METADHCWNCGSNVESDSNYCAECGAELDRERRSERDVDDRTGGYETGVDGTGDYVEDEYGTHRNDTMFAAATHLLAIFTWVIGPLIVLVVTEDEFVDANARTALNWQIMFTVWMVLSFVLALVVVGIIGLLILPLINIAFCVVAAVKANDGEVWQYPLTPEIV
ncbi:DUF4870 domain-containing protein [Halosolutus gelatinilyticus]|uniref:DUF4870 domain-containing protein n=1 Tax=Halosolutus gelatinilyticus TaxID=2931975 RepID=UPI001FF22F8F|nr:DUF4870 domain-containing protein [Halosolutus gelatinilyticus]